MNRTQIAKLTAADAAADDNFGASVTLDGEHALVGARFNDDAGAAYVFQRIGDAWSQTNELTADDAADGDRFGISVALDGNHALIGAFGHDDPGTNAGAAYAYLE